MPPYMIAEINTALKGEPVDYPTFAAVLRLVSHKDFGPINVYAVKCGAMIGNQSNTEVEAKKQEREFHVYQENSYKSSYVLSAHQNFHNLEDHIHDILAANQQFEEEVQFSHLQENISLKPKSRLERKLEQHKANKSGQKTDTEAETLTRNIASVVGSSPEFVNQYTLGIAELAMQEAQVNQKKGNMRHGNSLLANVMVALTKHQMTQCIDSWAQAALKSTYTAAEILNRTNCKSKEEEIRMQQNAEHRRLLNAQDAVKYKIERMKEDQQSLNAQVLAAPTKGDKKRLRAASASLDLDIKARHLISFQKT